MSPLRAAARLSLLSLAALAACSYRPPRFADRAPAATEGDDRPVPAPGSRDPGTAELVSEAWLRGPVADGLDPRRPPEAGDVNAFDDVVSSTWFHPTPDADEVDGPPRPPYTVREGRDDPSRIAVLDARGLAYELCADPAEHPEVRSGAGMVASRLVRALGWRTPETHLVPLAREDFAAPNEEHVVALFGPHPRAFRGLATRFPAGLDLGVTPPMGTRADDGNDRVPHENRRSLRALSVLGAWLAFDEIGPRTIRDVYVGTSPHGHVEHFVVGVERSLGVSSVLSLPITDSDAPASGWRALVMLGLDDAILPYRGAEAPPGLGELDEKDLGESVPIPWAPHARTTLSDRYWAAKRLSTLPPGAIPAAVASAKIVESSSRDRLQQILEARRRALMAVTFSHVTPAELVSLDASTLALRDIGRAAGVASVPSWSVTFLAEGGAPVGEPVTLGAGDDHVRIPLGSVLDRDYVVVRVQAGEAVKERPGSVQRQAMEVHLRGKGGVFHVVGIRH